VGNPGDRHYKCYHGNRKVITVTRAMKHNLNGKLPLAICGIFSSHFYVGLVGHLKMNFPVMYRFYLTLKDRNDLLTDEELAIASATRVFDEEAANTYLGGVERTFENLLSMFAKQSQQNMVSNV
jgi:hypothetical protein